MSLLNFDWSDCSCWSRDKYVQNPIVKKKMQLVRLTYGDIVAETEKKDEDHCSRKSDSYIYVGGNLVRGSDEIMAEKEHGTSRTEVQKNLRWNVDRQKADRICSYNRHYAERKHYASSLGFWSLENSSRVEFYDSVTGKALFIAPLERSWVDFQIESKKHGWPSFRDEDVVWENVRILNSGEVVSVDGTHLGHNLPDVKGNRYCINIVCIAGRPEVCSKLVEQSEPGSETSSARTA